MAKEIQITYKAFITEIYKDCEFNPGENSIDETKENLSYAVGRQIAKAIKEGGGIPDVTISNLKVFVIDGEEELTDEQP